MRVYKCPMCNGRKIVTPPYSQKEKCMDKVFGKVCRTEMILISQDGKPCRLKQKSISEKRIGRINLSCTERQRTKLERKASENGLALSAYIMKILEKTCKI